MKKILLFICLNIYFINYCAAFDPYPWTELPLEDEVFIDGEIYLKAEPRNYEQAEKSILESHAACEKSLEALTAVSKLTSEEEGKLARFKSLLAEIIKKDDFEQKELYDFLYDNFADSKMIKFIFPIQRQVEALRKSLRFTEDNNRLNVFGKISETLFFFMVNIEKYGGRYNFENCLEENCNCCYQVLSFFKRAQAFIKKLL